MNKNTFFLSSALEQPPMISVIIVNKNHGHFLEQALNSIALQNYIDYEVVLIDGLSTDNSYEVAKKFSNVRFISSQDASGAGAYARGVSESRGRYIAFLTSTDYFLDNSFFSRAISAFEGKPELSLVYGLHGIEDQKNLIAGNKIKFRNHPSQFMHWLITTEFFFELAILVKREVLINCLQPLTDFEQDISNLEEDMFFRLRFNFMKKGFVSEFIGGLVVFQRSHGDRVSDKFNIDFIRHVHFYKNQVNTFRRNLTRASFGDFFFINSNGEIISNMKFKFPTLKVFVGSIKFLFLSKVNFEISRLKKLKITGDRT